MPSARLSEGVTITWSFTDNPWFLIIGNLIHVKIGPHVGNSRDMSEESRPLRSRSKSTSDGETPTRSRWSACRTLRSKRAKIESPPPFATADCAGRTDSGSPSIWHRPMSARKGPALICRSPWLRRRHGRSHSAVHPHGHSSRSLRIRCGTACQTKRRSTPLGQNGKLLGPPLSPHLAPTD
jgi:hypothetical protein